MHGTDWNIKKLGQKCVLEKKMLGKGQYGTVFKGTYQLKENSTIEVAVKWIEKAMLNELMIIQLNREVAIQSKIEHPHVLKLYDTVETPNNFYVIMELCNLGSLPEPVEYKYSIELLNLFLVQIVDCFLFLQSQDVCHRDLKPANILLFSDIQIKLCDFGFAKIINPEQNNNHTQVGSPLYASPQIFLTKDYDIFKADIWSLGIVLYTMIFQKFPWVGNDNKQLLYAINNEELKFDPQVAINPQLQDLITKLLQKREKDRITWQQVSEHSYVLYALEEAQKYGNRYKFTDLKKN